MRRFLVLLALVALALWAWRRWRSGSAAVYRGQSLSDYVDGLFGPGTAAARLVVHGDVDEGEGFTVNGV